MRYLLVLLFFCCNYCLNAQENVVLESYVKEFSYHIERYQDSAKAILHEISKIESSDISVEFYKNYLEGVYTLKKENNRKALDHFNYLDSVLSKETDPLFYLKNKIMIGMAYRKLKDTSINIKYYFKNLLVLSDSINDTKSNIEIKLNLAKIHSKDSLFKAQEIYYSIIDDIQDKEGFEIELAYVYSSLGDFFYGSRNFDPNNKLSNAKTYYNKAINLAKKKGLLTLYYNTKLKLDPIIPSREEYKNNTQYYIDLSTKSVEEAYNYFNESKDFLGQINSLFYLGNNKRWLGDVKGAIALWEKGFELSADKEYDLGQHKMSKFIIAFSLRLKDFDKAEKYSFLMYNKSKNTNNFKARRDAELNLTDLYLAKKDYQKALRHSGLYWTLKDSIANREDLRVLNELETKYQTEKKEQEIALLKTQNALNEQKQKSQRNLLLSGLGLTTISGLFFFFLYKNRQKTTKRLKELDDFKSKLFANISHEFRTPLTLISGPIDKRLTDLDITEEDRDEFEMIQRNSSRLLNLVNQLLDLSKLESGHLKLKVAEGDLSALIKSMASAFRHKAIQKNIEYKIVIDDLDNVWFDQDVIEKTVANLLSNAFKYNIPNGNVIFKASVVESKLQLYFENESNELTKGQIDNIFNRFYQADENTDGVGIGLSLVKELVNLSHGKITVENTFKNTIVFKVLLPILKSQFKPEELTEDKIDIPKIEQKDNEVETKTKQYIDENLPILLIVDDQEDIRTFITSTFKNDYQVVEAANGKIGVEKAIELVPDIIISDVMMPKLNGFKLSENLKQDERTSHIPIILLTAKTEDADKFIGLETGADDYISKPFKILELETRVKNLINSRLKLRERYSQELVLKPTEVAISSFDAQFLEKVSSVIDENITEPSFSAEDFSKSVGMSRMQLHRKLKALTGLSATEFVRSQRLILAADLLKKSDANVSEIGYSVGFNDHSYFTKCFKDMYGCTPTEFISKL